ncbi:nuclear transport factor 2 family protein [Chryseobacterium sp.]|uniref:nuclear transport factor 2 family protein n=1 Tax=Chryseobacterium sp. TaxID=1871047 RepID=UPI001B072311|nr:nuclear transport factor 2 family protein [Chryseobacterium sp.]MBO9691683.1 nuclear transport factor 2 family protein [Chryseobacterium sp.]
MNNIDIIKSTYEGKNSEENGRNLAKYADPDISWTEAKGFPYGGTYIGLNNITENVFRRLGDEWRNYKFTPENYLSDNDQVVAYGTYSGTNNSTGRYFEARVAHLWKLQNGKIISFEQFVDSKTVADAYA